MEKISFNSKEHKLFYEEMLGKFTYQDEYHKAFFYCMGSCETTRKHINKLFDFDQGGINPDNINESFQTGTSYKVTRMAFNLWNGYVDENNPGAFTPNELFCCDLAKEFQQAIKLRYPDNFMEREKGKDSIREKIEVLQKKQEHSKDTLEIKIEKRNELVNGGMR
jgi:hypothetical protein